MRAKASDEIKAQYANMYVYTMRFIKIRGLIEGGQRRFTGATVLYSKEGVRIEGIKFPIGISDLPFLEGVKEIEGEAR